MRKNILSLEGYTWVNKLSIRKAKWGHVPHPHSLRSIFCPPAHHPLGPPLNRQGKLALGGELRLPPAPQGSRGRDGSATNGHRGQTGPCLHFWRQNLTAQTESKLKLLGFHVAACSLFHRAWAHHQDGGGRKSTISDKSIGGWGMSAGMRQERCCPHSDPWKGWVKMSSSFWPGISWEHKQAPSNEPTSPHFFFSLLCSVIFITDILHATFSEYWFNWDHSLG